MNEFVLKTRNLSKKYQGDFAIKDVNLTVRKGEIYGFIGQNGAGKSTFLRLATGLSFPTNGTVELFGISDQKEMTKALKRVGAIIESPALYPQMTAFQNLEVHRLQKGIPGKECIKKTLELVGLQHTGKKKTKNFSLGMKQRLGLAIALLGEPEFLILDEPTNGLDPTGIIELRELLKRLNKEKGLTILISSHILNELHQLATHYGIIHKGKLLEQLSSREMNDKCRKYIHIKVDSPQQAAVIIESKLETTNFEVMPDDTIKLYEHIDTSAKVSKVLSMNGLTIEQFALMGDTLENYFTKLIGGEDRE
ncbi:ABC-2 type transport system ATP-binding protein [Bacillus sp. 491mf]|uniref:ABC transporter ATP-binding protein n=1 Tax=Bacillus sp. 491mf TaxID=1761755 RepID=UPI0008F0BC5C|nr:ABC transporter ATP-binding protein [Bacillus sp. 491mf]SFC69520.1 ABC-2 type transport system ATP-binding protein [Bacillus sp. 491mf]